MVRWLLAVGVLATLPLGLADAEPVTLEAHLAMHVSEAHTVTAPRQAEHVFGVASFRGLAIFDDGRIAVHEYAGGFDFVAGAGTFHGEARWVFDDGSTLTSRYVGEAEPLAEGGITFAGSHSDVTGTGAYVGVTGTGTFEGRRIDALSDDGETYQRVRLELELAD